MIALESRTAPAEAQATPKGIPACHRLATRDKADRIDHGLSALIDADLTRESARLQALQMRQQLAATRTLSLARPAPQTLLSLLR